MAEYIEISLEKFKELTNAKTLFNILQKDAVSIPIKRYLELLDKEKRLDAQGKKSD